jgi:hypothetical protein
LTEAVKELVAAAEECASRRYEPRFSKAVEAVKAEEKPQTHEFIGSGVIQDYCIHADSASEFCGQSVFTPIHQTGGK